MKQQKLRKIGNSIGIITPKEILDMYGLSVGDSVYVENQDKGIKINKDSTYSTVSPEFLKVAEEVSKKYSDTFKELASK